MARSHFLLRLASAGLAVLLLAGCGAASPSGSPSASSAPNAAYLSGNWLLAGSLPAFPSTGTSTNTGSGFGLTATFDVAGSQVTGIVTGEFTCSSFTSLGSGGVVAGTVAADGSFTLTSPFNAGSASTATLTGKAPISSGGAWSGTYAVTSSLGMCTSPLTGAIAATSLPPVTGTYAGTVSLSPMVGATSSPTTVKVTLQQGGAATNVLGNSLQSNTVLTGSIAVQGSSCYSSGTTTSSPIPGAVEGNTVLGFFLMNDGSKLEMIGTTAAADSSQLSVSFLTITAGTCPTVFSGAALLTR